MANPIIQVHILCIAVPMIGLEHTLSCSPVMREEQRALTRSRELGEGGRQKDTTKQHCSHSYGAPQLGRGRGAAHIDNNFSLLKKERRGKLRKS